MTKDQDNTAPIFIVGVGRSGTTLLRLMINQHPDIVIPHESWFVAELLDLLPQDRALSPAEVERAVDYITGHQRWRFWALDPEALKQRIARLQDPTLAALIDTVFRQVADAADKPRWGDKSPLNTEYIDRIHALFPSARFIHIIRDARDVAKSYKRLGWHGAFLFRNASWWDGRVRTAIEMGRALPPSLYMQVRYEDLVLHPERELRSVCRFLGIAFVPDMLSFHETADQNITALEKHTAVHESLQRAPRHDDVERWRRTMSPFEVATVEAIAGRTMAMVNQSRQYPVSSAVLRLVLWVPNWLLERSNTLRRRLGLTARPFRMMARLARGS